MTKPTASAQAMEDSEPAIRMVLGLNSENHSEGIASVEIYMPDGVPQPVKAALEKQCREIICTIAENLLVGWSL